MVVFSFSVEDMARVRFAVSPIWELAASLQTLRDPGRSATHVRWVRSLRGKLSDLDLAAALRLTPAQGYVPDFLTPPPSGPLAEIDEQLAEMRRVPPDQVAREVGWCLQRRPAPPALAPFGTDPAAALAHLADQLEAYWERAPAPPPPPLRPPPAAHPAH